MFNSHGTLSSLRPWSPSWLSVSAQVLFVSFSLALALPPLALADFIPPSQTTLKTTAYKPNSVALSPSWCDYVIRWQGIPVAEAQIDAALNSNANRGRISIAVQTTGAIDLLYTLRHQSHSEFQIQDFKPLRYSYAQHENSRERGREIVFTPAGEVQATLWKVGKKGREEEQIAFSPNNLTLDPISGALLARSLPLEVGKSIDLDIFNGKHRFLITFHVKAEENVKLKDQTVRAFRIEPTVKRLTDSNPEERLKSATIWISADQRREILKMESKVWLGSVTALLKRSGTTTGQGVDLRRAQLKP